MNTRTILIVDDQVINRRILHRLLEKEYQIMEAENGEQALKVLREHGKAISAVLLDIIMPVLDGYGVLKAMKDDPELNRIPVIVSSQEDGDAAEIKALSLGAQDFIAKPYKSDIIRHRLENTIRLRETAAIANQAERDELTGLYNKRYFTEKVEERLRENTGERYNLLCLGVERFKLVNATYGIKKGDDLLRYIAGLLLEAAGERGICAHFNADAFFACLPYKKVYTEEDFEPWLRRLSQFPIDMDIRVHCGIYEIKDATLSVDVMCDCAQLAADKNRGKYDTCFSYYDDSIQKQMMEEQFITTSMQAGLDQHQFQVYYQPKYDLHTEMVAGAEALVRWMHPERGFMSPGSFIPLFEKNGFITQLDRYVWEQACVDIRGWMDSGMPPVPVSVNVSRADIFNPKLCEILTGLVEKYQIPMPYLHLEITESAYTDNPEQIVEVVGRLHDLGFVIEMDDFGSGYSSLNMLAELPVDILKLDMRFVQTESTNTSGRGIMSFVISLAKWMKLSVIAEGVETAEQIISLRSMDCNFVQGYYYAKPMPKADFEKILKTVAVVDQTDQTADSDLISRKNSKRHSDKVMLIVDDIEVNRAVLEGIFYEEYEIVEKENGQEALEYLQQNYQKVGVILLDLLMPVMDGFQLLAKMKADPCLSDIPVVVTSQGDVTAEERALASGADDFISKPYSPQIVCHRVHNVVDTHRVQLRQEECLDAKPEETESALEEQNRYRYIMDNLDVAYFELDSEGNFYASDKYALYVMSEEKPEDILADQGSYDGIHPEDLPLMFEFFALKKKNLPKISATMRLKMKDGTYRWTEVMGFFEFDEQGNRTKSIGVLRDVDQEWLNQNRKLQDALHAAEMANEAKTNFLARVSHNIRTPLNGIIGITALMEGKTAGESISHELMELKQSGTYLMKLIDDTLDVSTIEHNKMELHPEVCDGKTAFQSVIAMVKASMDAKGIQFQLKADNLPFTKLYMDVGRVEQSVVNILSNAIKFTPEGGTIEFEMENLSQENGIITDRIRIRDNGIGMSPEFLEHIFEPFTQEHNDSKSTYHGTGLGMTIARQCMELMGGSIQVKSEQGKGTEVSIILPMPIATSEQLHEWNRRNSEQNLEILKGKRILLCEDHPLNAEISIHLLEKKGMKVDRARDGKEGLEMFVKSDVNHYDAILMDLRMPVMDGLEASRRIRGLKRKDARKIPIIAMTANILSEDVKNAINAGMSEHLGKPVEPERLYNTLAAFIANPNPFAGKKVLVVDDIDMNRTFIRVAIEGNYTVLEAGSGQEALDILKKEGDIAAVVTDIQMPVMDGKELIRRIRDDRAYDDVAILANTIYGDHRQEDELLSLGANDFVYKPSSPQIIMMRLEHIMRNKDMVTG